MSGHERRKAAAYLLLQIVRNVKITINMEQYENKTIEVEQCSSNKHPGKENCDNSGMENDNKTRTSMIRKQYLFHRKTKL